MQGFADRIERLSSEKRALLEQWRRSNSHASQVTIPRRAAHAFAPLSIAQERLWFLDQLQPHTPCYNVATAVRLAGRLNVSALEQALRAVIDRHDVLRTTFRAIDGCPRQVLSPKSAWHLERHELREPAADRREIEWRRRATLESLRPFDLDQGPLIRGTLIRVGPQDHVLLLTLHHIICDGWSMAVMRREVAECYQAAIEGRPVRLDPLDIHYADFAAWQREQLDGSALTGLLDYWSRQLANLPGPLELPWDHPRPPKQAFGGDVHRLSIGPSLVEALRRVSRQQDATLFMTLLAAFHVLLSRYTGQRDICVGSPTAQRNHVELERLIGFFVNTLVLRTDLSANPTIRDLLVQVRRTTIDAHAHQDLPFARLVEHLNPVRDLSSTPLFQVMFVLQNIPIQTQQLADLTATEIRFDHAPVANFDLTLNVDEHPDRLDLSLVYDTALFLPQTVERMLDSYQLLLSEFCGDLDRPVLTLPVVPPAEQLPAPAVVAGRSETGAGREPCIHELFVAQASRIPDALAVVTREETLTYRELDSRSNQMARYLAARGVGPDVPVGVCLLRSAELIVSMLGILKAGGAYVPLDPLYPQARLEYMARDAGLRLLVTTAGLSQRIGCRQIASVLIDADLRAIGEESRESFVSPATARNLVYIIYTSGSTGEPKGVEVEHRSLVNHAQRFSEQIGLIAGDRMLQFLSPSFDAAGEEIFPTLIRGATLCLHPSPAELSGGVLLDWSRQQRVNVLHLTPPVWLSLIDELEAQGFDAGRHLKTVIAGGESVRHDDVIRWRQVTGGHIPFHVAYGVTEATITTTVCSSDSEFKATPSGNFPIGRPLDNTRIYVLDEFQQPVPTGVRGEIYIGGVGVARGYHNRDGSTRRRFLADPCSGHPDARMYRTGDAGRFRHDGHLEFLGRLDRQVKVRGYRIEPGEVEAALREHADVREAVVVTQSDLHGTRLFGYAAIDSASATRERELKDFLTGRLPPHLVPGTIVIVDRLPRLPNGKIDLRALPQPRPVGEPDRPVTAPRNDIEQTLAAVWASVLEITHVGVHDNFFEIGGDSIRSIQVVARARDRGIQFTPKQLFEHQTIAELARVVQAGGTIHAEQGAVTGPAPLTPIQHEFFALNLSNPHHFNQSVLLELTKSTPPADIEAALQRLAAHHDALRLRFTPSPEGMWQQTGMPVEDRLLLKRIDLSATSDASISMMIEQHATQLQTELDLTTGNLLRAAYFDLGTQRSARLLIVIHHLAVDAVSWRILLEDLATIFLQLAEGRLPQLPPKTTSFFDWSRRLTELADSDAVRGEREKWISVVSPQPTEQDRGAAARAESKYGTEAVIQAQLSAEATARWRYDCHRAYRTRPHELLIAALVDTLAQESADQLVRLDLEGHGRQEIFDDVDLSRTVGWFTTLYPLAVRHPGLDKPADLILAVKEQLRAIPHGGLGYGLLRWLTRDTATRDALADGTRSDTSFNYLGQFDKLLSDESPLALASEPTGPNRSPHGRRPHVWEIVAYVRGESLHVQWHYSTALHDRPRIERLANNFVNAIERLIDHCLDPGAGKVSPVDFPLADLDQHDLDRLGDLLDESAESDAGAEHR